jgi:hypothetical protein
VCQEEISKEINEADYLAVIADETSDVMSQIYFKWQSFLDIYRVITKQRPSLYLSYLTPDFNEQYIKLNDSKSSINWI